jgi:hypothetical protein
MKIQERTTLPIYSGLMYPGNLSLKKVIHDCRIGLTRNEGCKNERLIYGHAGIISFKSAVFFMPIQPVSSAMLVKYRLLDLFYRLEEMTDFFPK